MPSAVRSESFVRQAFPKDTIAQLENLRSRSVFTALKRRELALAEAERMESGEGDRKPLFGLLFAVKDNIDVAGIPTTAACPTFAYMPDRSATVVQRLEQAGAILVGKTNMDQFATGLVGVRSPFGIAPNALRSDLIPGGSSSGSAVAVARGFVDFSLGTDTAGSGRIPAGMNGIVGLKPSLGLISSTGVVPACRTLDTVSIFSRDVETAFRVLQVIAAYDAEDPFSRNVPRPVLEEPKRQPKVGVPPASQRMFFGDDAAEAAFSADLETLQSLGFAVVEVDFEPLHAVARLLYEGPWVAERYAAIRSFIESNPSALLPVTFSVIGPSKNITAVEAFESMYRLKALKRQLEPVLQALDCLAVPTVPRFYRISEIAEEPIAYNANLGTYTNFVNLLDLAAITLPVGIRSDGLPSSVTFIGPADSDGLLASLALRVENRPAR
ncbi:allophanate hydrolase [Affinirhizobium pseudoryzae]|jgi:allophanate hydrolase|uniref:allophanate hydrolase n=1 Tax=Allorhizobium pseudoryzae TaxID=379684 RepID=UPI0013EDF27B|nr:allophanate hydrolase [Allorhizobium pseudoryzae]